MVAGQKTAANEIIALAGGVNAIDGYDGYKIISDEAIVAAKPDVVLSIQRGKDSLEADAVFAHPAFALTPAAANKAFIAMEGLYLLGFGPRTAAAARDLSRQALSRAGAAGRAIQAGRARRQIAGNERRDRGRCGRAKRRSGIALRPAAIADPHWPARWCSLAAALIALTMGAAGIPLSRLPAALGLWTDAAPHPLAARDQLVLWSIRIPRIAVAAMVGGLLAASGAIMQGLFRNPLADPALVGVSSGGAFAAACAIVFTDSHLGESLRFMQNQLLPLAAFFGSLVTTIVLYGIASRCGPNLDRDLPAGGARDRRHRQCRHRASGVHRRRPPVARHHVLAAGLAERRDLAEGRHAGAGAGAGPDRLPVDRARARRAGARRGRGVSQRRRRRTAEADLDRAGVGDDRRCGRRSAASSDSSASWCRICCGW